MKTVWVIIILCLALSAHAQTVGTILDINNKQVLKSGFHSMAFTAQTTPYQAVIVLTDTRDALKSQLCDACPPCPTGGSVTVTIDGAVVSVGSLTIAIKTVSPAPIPTPIPTPTPTPIPTPTPTPTPTPGLTRPAPPFPKCWWGPRPEDKHGLIAYIDGMGTELQKWCDWLKAHPEDLDWAWSEYKKAN